MIVKCITLECLQVVREKQNRPRPTSVIKVALQYLMPLHFVEVLNVFVKTHMQVHIDMRMSFHSTVFQMERNVTLFNQPSVRID